VVVVEEEVEGEEVKQHERLQHTKASTGPVHPPGCKKSDRQRAAGEVAYRRSGAAVEVAMRVNEEKLLKKLNSISP
jgi:hypothetical protein